MHRLLAAPFTSRRRSPPWLLGLVLLALPAGAVGDQTAERPGEPSRSEGRAETAAESRAETPSGSQPAGAKPGGRVSAPAAPQRPAAGTTVEPVRPRRVSVLDRGTIELAPSRSPQGRWKGFPISLSLRDAPLPEVLRSFARIAGINLVLDPDVQGEVTVELKDVPWDQALHVILRSHGMGAEIDGNVWLVEPR